MSSKRSRNKKERMVKEWKINSESKKVQKKEFDFVAGQMIFF
ncbi:MAG: hypothetical protein ACXAAM_05930 [Candidatus Heimdallarchaeaceae archaeon]|jgi:hypothetical protein